MATGPSATQGGNFTLFSLLPAELRHKIWHQTWEPRVVDTLRRHSKNHSRYFNGMSYEDLKLLEAYDLASGPKLRQNKTRDKASVNANCFPDGVDRTMHKKLATRHAHAMLLEWGEDAVTRPPADDQPSEAPPAADKAVFFTTTRTNAAEPVALFVNRESRTETLKHYKLAWGLPGGVSQVYFNFDLDILAFDINGGPVLFMYQQADLVQLQRAMILVIAPHEGPPIGHTYMKTCWFNRSTPETFDIPEGRASGNPFAVTGLLRADHSIAGTKRRFPSLREIFVRADEGWAVNIPPTEMDATSAVFQRDDFRYACSPDSGVSDTRRWKAHHFMFRPEAGIITSHPAIMSRVVQYTRAGPRSGCDLDALEKDTAAPVEFTGYFLCKIAISTGVQNKPDINSNEIFDCEVKWEDQVEVKDIADGGHSGRLLSSTCRRIQLWNGMSDWVSKYMGHEILVDHRHPFQLEL